MCDAIGRPFLCFVSRIPVGPALQLGVRYPASEGPLLREVITVCVRS